jgi:hypothetical protein
VAGPPHRACRDRNRNPRWLVWVRRRSALDCPRQPLADRSAQVWSADPTRDASPRRPFPHRNRCAPRLRMNCPVPSVTSCFGVPADFLLPSQNLAERVTYSRHGLGLRFVFTTHCPALASVDSSAVLVGLFRARLGIAGERVRRKAAGQQRASCFLLVSPPTDLGTINSVSATETDSEPRYQQAVTCAAEKTSMRVWKRRGRAAYTHRGPNWPTWWGRAAARLAFARPPPGNELLVSGASVSSSFDLPYHYPLLSKRRRGTRQSCWQPERTTTDRPARPICRGRKTSALAV